MRKGGRGLGGGKMEGSSVYIYIHVHVIMCMYI